MVITSGWAKGLNVATPRGATTRPTSARLRGAILNMLAPQLEGALFLDLFAGSGALGLEAVSRGARGAVFVEQEREALACLRRNVAELARRAGTQAIAVEPLEVVAGELGALLAGGRLARWGKADLVFADPPYKDAAGWVERLLVGLTAVVGEQAVLVLETAKGDGAGAVVQAATGSATWELVKQRAYGDTIVSIIERSQPDPTPL